VSNARTPKRSGSLPKGLPVKIDDADLPREPSSIGFCLSKTWTPEMVAELLMKKIREKDSRPG